MSDSERRRSHSQRSRHELRLIRGVLPPGVLELSVAMMEVTKRQMTAAQDAVAARRALQQEARVARGGTTLPSGVRQHSSSFLLPTFLVKHQPHFRTYRPLRAVPTLTLRHCHGQRILPSCVLDHCTNRIGFQRALHWLRLCGQRSVCPVLDAYH